MNSEMFKISNYDIIQPNSFSSFLSLFGDISHSSKDDIIISDGSLWVKKSSNKKNVFINYKGIAGHNICNILPKNNPVSSFYEYIVYVTGYLKIDNNDYRIDISYIVTKNNVTLYGFNTGTVLIGYTLNNNIFKLFLIEDTSTYSLEIKTRIFTGQLNELEIEVDMTDKTKTVNFFLNF
jgi:hypothetical protein